MGHYSGCTKVSTGTGSIIMLYNPLLCINIQAGRELCGRRKGFTIATVFIVAT